MNLARRDVTHWFELESPWGPCFPLGHWHWFKVFPYQAGVRVVESVVQGEALYQLKERGVIEVTGVGWYKLIHAVLLCSISICAHPFTHPVRKQTEEEKNRRHKSRPGRKSTFTVLIHCIRFYVWTNFQTHCVMKRQQWSNAAHSSSYNDSFKKVGSCVQIKLSGSALTLVLVLHAGWDRVKLKWTGEFTAFEEERVIYK